MLSLHFLLAFSDLIETVLAIFYFDSTKFLQWAPIITFTGVALLKAFVDESYKDDKYARMTVRNTLDIVESVVYMFFLEILISPLLELV